jgi:hypothetical protein
MAVLCSRSGVSFGFILSSVSCLLVFFVRVFFLRCADEELRQSDGQFVLLLVGSLLLQVR